MKVVIVEDEDDTRKFLEVLITAGEENYEVIATHSGEEAWAKIQTIAEPFITLLDRRLRGTLDGIELCTLIRNERPQGLFAYVIFFSGFVLGEHVEEGFNAGANDYIKKPVDAKELMARIRLGRLTLTQMQDLRRDPATGVWMKAALDDKADVLVHRSKTEGKPISALVIDIDDFKSVNDNHGHDVGDQVLKDVSSRVRNILKQGDEIGRHIRGDEFFIVCPNCSEKNAMRLGERIVKHVAKNPVKVNEELRISVTVSVGVATLSSKDTSTAQELVRRADQALLNSKGQGKNRVTLSPKP